MPISIELARAVLSNVLYNLKRRMVIFERIVHAVSEYYSVDLDALKGQRDRAIVMPRQIAMYLMRAETDVSLLRTGCEPGGRDHQRFSMLATRSTKRPRRTRSCGAIWLPSAN